MLVHDTVSVKAGKALEYNFSLPAGARVLAQFQVQGGLNDKIRILVLDVANHELYSAGRPFRYVPGTSGLIRGAAKSASQVPRGPFGKDSIRMELSRRSGIVQHSQ
jgi:hypothetical protein